jgi:hypothetical protein
MSWKPISFRMYERLMISDKAIFTVTKTENRILLYCNFRSKFFTGFKEDWQINKCQLNGLNLLS